MKSSLRKKYVKHYNLKKYVSEKIVSIKHMKIFLKQKIKSYECI